MEKFLDSLSKEDSLNYKLSLLYKQWGYKEFRMAKFEEYSFYSDNRDFLSGEGILAFNNSDGRLMALKPDITLSIVKNAKLSNTLTKLYYNESVFRMTDSSHDYKEIKQTGVEVLGNVDDYVTSEVILLAAKSLMEIDKDFVLNVSHMSFIPSVIAEMNISENAKKAIVACVRGKNSHDLSNICAENEVNEEKTRLICTLAGISGSPEKVLPTLKELACNEEMQKACRELEMLADSLKTSPLCNRITIDLSVINNIDYYNGIIFQGFVEKAPKAVLSGGRYDNLSSKIRANTQAIGFAVYLDDLNLYYKKKREYDFDALVIAKNNDTSSGLLACVDALVESGMSVRVETSDSQGFKAKKTFIYENNELKEVTEC